MMTKTSANTPWLGLQLWRGYFKLIGPITTLQVKSTRVAIYFHNCASLTQIASGDQILRYQEIKTPWRLGWLLCGDWPGPSAKNDNNWRHLDTIIIPQLTLITSHLSGFVCTISYESYPAPAPGLGSRVSSLVFPRLHHYPALVSSKTRESLKPF